MKEEYFKKVLTAIIFLVLLVLTFLLLKPILLSIIIAFILAFVFNPIYNKVNQKVKSKNLSATIMCVFLALLIIIPLWFLTPIIVNQSIKVYLVSQQIDFVTPLKNIFPSLFASEQFSAEIGSVIHSFVTNMTNSLMNSLASLISNFPKFFLESLIVFFTFFFVLRDKDQLFSYIKSLSPFSNEVEKKLFESSKGITSSVIYGQVIVGMAQGIAVGIGFFLFGIPNALFLTLLACFAGIFPIIGTTIIWAPVVIYSIIAGNTFPAIGIIIFGLISSLLDNLLRPIIVSRKAKMSSPLILISMIGGLYLFGIIGFILGPLIIAYLIIVTEIYRSKKGPIIFEK